MRYRKLGPDGDYVFGPSAVFLVDSPEAVAQAVRTRMDLLVGEWFLDTRTGLDRAAILGKYTEATRDFEVQERITGTQGVRSILAYSSRVEGRAFIVEATLDTIYGQTTIEETFQ